MTVGEQSPTSAVQRSGESTGVEFTRGYPVVLTAMLGASLGAAGLTSYMIPYFVDPLNAEFGWTRAQITGAVPFIFLGAFIAAPWTGRLCDRIGTRKLATGAFILFSCGMASMSLLGDDIAFFYAGYFLLLLVGAGTMHPTSSRAVNTWFDKGRGLALGLVTCGAGIANVIGPQFVPDLIDAHGWRAAYVALGAVALIPIPFVWLFLRERETTTARPLSSSGFTFSQIYRTRKFWLLLVAIFLVHMATFTAVLHNLPLLEERGMSRDAALNAVSLFGIAMIAGRILTGLALDRLPGSVVGSISFAAPVVGLVAITLGGPDLAWVFAITLGMAVGAEGDLIAFTVSRHFGIKAYAETVGWVYGIAAAGGAVGPLIANVIMASSANYGPLMIVWAAFCLIATTVFATLGKYPTQLPS